MPLRVQLNAAVLLVASALALSSQIPF